MTTRTVTGPFHGPQDIPLSNFALRFTVMPTAYTSNAHYPSLALDIETDENGDFAVELVTGVQFRLDLVGAAVTHPNGVKTHPDGTTDIRFVVPDGPGSISLQTIRALGSIDPDDPSVADIIANAINEYMANNGVADAVDTINAHVGDTDNPHGVTAAQVGLGNVANLAPADLPVSDATQSALDDKADQSLELADAIDQRHEHANKAVLDDITPAMLVPTPSHPFIRYAQQLITPITHGFGGTATVNTLIHAGILVMAPIYLPSPGRLIMMQLGVVIPVEDGAARMGLFTVSPNGSEATLVVDAGVVDTSTTGLKNIGSTASPIGAQIGAGWYWVAILASENVTITGTTMIRGISISNTSLSPSSARTTLQSSVPYGGLPETAIMSTSTYSTPNIGLHIGQPS